MSEYDRLAQAQNKLSIAIMDICNEHLLTTAEWVKILLSVMSQMRWDSVAGWDTVSPVEDALRARIARLEAAGYQVTAMLKSLIDFGDVPKDSCELAYQVIKAWQEAHDRPQE